MPTEEEFALAKKVWDKVFGQEWTIESQDYQRKKEGIKYLVKQKCDDEWSCDCPSFIYGSGTCRIRNIATGKIYENTCKHIRWVMAHEKMKWERIF